MAKQNRIRSIMWHLRWLVRSTADINPRQSGLVRPRTDINYISSKVMQGLDTHIYMYIVIWTLFKPQKFHFYPQLPNE